MTIKTDVSRFHIHDELTAPDASAPLIKSIKTGGGTVSKFLGVLAESPAALRAYTRLRTELRESKLERATRERIGLAVAERRQDPYTLTQYARTAKLAGLGLDEVARARNFTSSDEKEAALLALLKETLANQRPPHHLVEEAREAGWTDEEILDAVAEAALAEFESLIASVAALPQEGDPAVLREAAASPPAASSPLSSKGG
jgi:alkylhydroperoxidase family enzyme